MACQGSVAAPTGNGRSAVTETKPFTIEKRVVFEAYKRVRAKKGSAGVDGESLEAFEADLGNNLYKLWNRMSSGSYHPQPVKRVEIAKGDGSKRPLGIPTVTDRIAQMTVKLLIEPGIDSQFHQDSYGYRPGKSAHQALKQARSRCYERAWVLDLDIKGFFDNLDHDLLNKALDRHVTEPWQRLYIQRWLNTPIRYADGSESIPRKGTPQGGVISPLLANLYLHYVFDVWIERQRSGIRFERYADDIVCHCVSERDALELKALLETRFSACGLTLHPEKTRIVHCKGVGYRKQYKTVSFDFLGYSFRPRWLKDKLGRHCLYFVAEISRKSAKAIRQEINCWPWHYWVQKELEDIRRYSVARLRGWIEYFGLFGKSGIRNVLFHFDKRLTRWAMRKYKQLNRMMKAARKISETQKKHPWGFPHWQRS